MGEQGIRYLIQNRCGLELLLVGLNTDRDLSLLICVCLRSAFLVLAFLYHSLQIAKTSPHEVSLNKLFSAQTT